MTRLIYITHPETIINPQVPIRQWQISKNGKKQINHLLQLSFWKDMDVMYSSNEGKALHTAQEIENHCVHVKFPMPFGNEDLSEVERIFLRKKEYENTLKAFYSHPDKSSSGWETANDAAERTIRVISQIMEENSDKTVAIIGHGIVGALLVCFLKKKAPTEQEIQKKLGSLIHIDWDNKKVLSEWIGY